MVGIGFFAPFPLALMVPFMAGQSLAMGEAFGKGFQYGKRKISSMSNEEFNALNFQQLAESIHTDYKMMIPSLEQSIKASDRLQDAVFKALADVIKDIPSQILDFFGDVSGASRSALPSTTTSTSASQFGVTTQVRAGSGLGDIRKQQEQSREQQLRRDTSGMTLAQHEANKRKQEALESAARARTQSEINSQKARKALEAEVARTGVVTSKRAAGQSQIAERNRLISGIAAKANNTAGLRKINTRNQYDSQIAANNRDMQTLQAKLTILLQRYRF